MRSIGSSYFVIRAKGPLIIQDIGFDADRMKEGFLGLGYADGRSQKLIWVESLDEFDCNQHGIFHLSHLPMMRGLLQKHPVLKLTEPRFCPIEVGAPLDEATLCELDS